MTHTNFMGTKYKCDEMVFIEYANGGKHWYRDGKLHRDNGPAIEYANGDKYWYQNGLLHRENGPAVEYPSGDKLWYFNGKQIVEKLDWKKDGF